MPSSPAVAVHPSAFPLGQLAGVLAATRATLVQPSIRAQVHGTHHTFLRIRPAHMSCMATTVPWVEMQTPIFAGDAWAAYHENVLSAISDEHLAASDFGVDVSWCAALRDAFPTRPACLVTPGEAATHLNTHAIEQFMVQPVVSKVRSCDGTCMTLVRQFHTYWRNFSHHDGTCYGVGLAKPDSANPGHPVGRATGLIAAGRLGIDRQGGSRARYPSRWQAPVTSTSVRVRDATGGGGAGSGGAAAATAADSAGTRNATAADRTPEEVVAALGANATYGSGAVSIDDAVMEPPTFWLGATSLASADGRRVNALALSLGALLNDIPQLRVAVNFNDGLADGSPRKGAPVDQMTDVRVDTYWVRGSRARFWTLVLAPAMLARQRIAYIWLFSSCVFVHPAINPLRQMHQLLRATDASVVFLRPPSPSRPSTTLDGTSPSRDDAAPPSTPAAKVTKKTASSSTNAALEVPNSMAFDITAAALRGRCNAASARAVSLSTFAFARTDAWELFHKRVLSRLGTNAAPTTVHPSIAEHVAKGLGAIFCGLSAVTWARPACVEHLSYVQTDANVARSVEREQRLEDELLAVHVSRKGTGTTTAPKSARAAGTPRIDCMRDRACLNGLQSAYGERIVNASLFLDLPRLHEGDAITGSPHMSVALCWTMGVEGFELTANSKSFHRKSVKVRTALLQAQRAGMAELRLRRREVGAVAARHHVQKPHSA